MADEAKVKVKINGDAKEAVGALKAVDNALKAIKGSIGKVMMALGLLGLAWDGIQKVIEGIKALREWMNRAARAAAQARIAAIFKDAADAMDGLLRKQSVYNALLRDELATLQRREEIDDLERGGRSELETARREASRAQEMAGVTDPRRQMEIRQRWRVEDEQRERARKVSDYAERETYNFNLSASYGSKAKGAGEAAAEAQRAIDELNANYERFGKEQREEANKQIAALEEKRKALLESQRQWQDEADQAERREEFYRSQRKALRDLPSLAAQQNANETDEFNRKEAEELEKKRVERERESNDAAERFVQGHIDEQRREAEGRLSEAEGFQDRFLAASGTSGNRLTAMGLGGGVTTSPVVAKMGGDIARLVELQRKQVEELRDLKAFVPSGFALEP